MTLHPLLLVLLIGIIIGNTQVSKYINKKNETMDMEKAPLQRKENYYFSLGDEFSFAKEIRLDGLANWVLQLYREQFGKVYEITKKKNSNSCREMTFGKLCVFLEQFLAYGYLFYMVLYGELSAGSFTMYLTAILSFNAVVTETLQIIGKLQQSTVYMEQFKAFMTYPCEEKNNQEHHNFKNSSVENSTLSTICFEDVSFRYPGQEAYALRHVSCEIKSGEKIAIVGENGAGKTTFIKLLLRLYRPEEGRILFNGKDINTMEYEQYLELFSVVFQDYKLFAMTIRENIALKNEAFSDRELEQIAQLLGFNEKLERLPDGLHTPVYKTFDENGFEPSGGEAQKIAMARAFARKAPIVILDEPVAALDPMAEYEIYCNFSKLVQEKTAIFISHRLASCRVCDRIFVFLNLEQVRNISNDSFGAEQVKNVSNGSSFTAKQAAAALEPDFYSSIAECGTHEELLSAGGYYAEVYRMQAAWYEEAQTNV